MRALALLGALGACGRLGFTDQAPPDSTPVDGPVVTCPAGALLCDDFEAGDLAKWTRKVIGGAGTATVTTAVAHSGAHALQLDYPSSGTSGAAAIAFSHTVNGGTLAVREWVQSADPLTKFNLVLTEANLGTGQFVTAGGNNSALWVTSERNAGGTLIDHDSSVATAITQWTCVETVITLASPPQIQLFVDGSQIVSVAMNDVSPAYTETQIGLARADQGGDTLYVDDVVIATTRIGCN